MKKNLLLLIILTVSLFAGCSKKDQMVSFIPTPTPSVDVTVTPEPTLGDKKIAVTPTPKPIHIGKTKTMYVKLNEYNDTLNVRSAPSTDAEKVGFLVHTEKIEVMDIVDGWASFVYNNVICYVNADFLVDKQPDYLEPPTPSEVPKSNTNRSSSNNTDI